MSISKWSFVLLLAIIYAVYQSYNLRVDWTDFAVSQRRKINAESTKLFDFLVLTHILEKWLPVSGRLVEADAKTLGVGKYFGAFFKLPLIGEWNIYLITSDYKRGKLLALESSDGFLNPIFELRTNNYHHQTILQVTIYFKQSSSIFHIELIVFFGGCDASSASSIDHGCMRLCLKNVALADLTKILFTGVLEWQHYRDSCLVDSLSLKGAIVVTAAVMIANVPRHIKYVNFNQGKDNSSIYIISHFGGLYTIGSYLRSVTKLKFEQTIAVVEDMYKATDKYRELT